MEASEPVLNILERPWARILLSLVLVVVIGSSLAAPISWGAKALATSLEGSALLNNAWLADLHESLGSSPFTRYYDRAILLAAILVLVPLRRWLGGPGGELDCRVGPAPIGGWFGAGHHWLAGFLIAGAALLTLGMLYLGISAFHPRPPSGSSPAWFGHLVSALTVGVLEEALFRGLILAIVLRSMRTVPAIFFVSLLFAILHFVHPPEEDLPRTVEWLDGWRMSGVSLQRMLQPNDFLAELCTLFAVGWVLASLRLRSGSIWLPAGVHAGWVFCLKQFSSMARDSAAVDRGEMLPWIGGNLRTGLAPLLFILITWAVVCWWLRLSGEGRKADLAVAKSSTTGMS